MRTNWKVALAQIASRPFLLEDNLQAAVDAAGKAADAGAEVILFPEMFLTGYVLGEAAEAFAMPVEASALAVLRQCAAERNIAIVMGFPHRAADGKVYNAAAFLDRDGSLAGIYHKTHRFGEVDKAQFAPGGRITAFDTTLGRVGMQICYDIEFPEVSRRLALSGAELLLGISANMHPYTDLHALLVRARAIENHLPFAYINAVGQEGDFTYCGRSEVVNAEGVVLTAGGEEEEILFADLPAADHADENLEYLTQRRTDLY